MQYPVPGLKEVRDNSLAAYLWQIL